MKNHKEKITISIIIIIFIVIMLYFSKYTSPLYQYNYGYDSAIFTLMGKSIISGKIIYKELFDHKGPILFFIEAIGYKLNKRYGIFLIQNLFGIINLTFIYKIWNLLKKENKVNISLIMIFLSFISILLYTFEGGNLSEEYSLPFISICLYLFIKYAKNTKKQIQHPKKYSFIYGVSLAILSLIRINNAVTIFSGIFTIIIYLIFKKEYKNLLSNLLFGLLGCLFVVVPVFIYFYQHNSLYDMIYATFIYNFKYVNNIGHNQILNNIDKYILLYIPLFISIILIFANKTRKKIIFLDFMLITIVLFNFICLIIANTYAHYFTIYIPVYITIISRYFNNDNNNKIKLLKLIIIILIINIYSYNNIINYKKDISKQSINEMKYHTIKNDLDLIPEYEKKSVIGYNIPAAYYLIGDIIPCYKYYIYQDWWSISNEEIKIEFFNWLKKEKPKWIITTKEEDKEIIEIINNSYRLETSNEYINLYYNY